MADDFFTEFGETLHQAAKEFSAKTDNFFESQKARNKINGEQKQIDQCLKDIGNIIYKKFVNGEPMHEEVAALCEEITEHKVAIAKMKENMARKKGEKICANCGAALPKDAQFCLRCGAECKEEPEEEVVEDPRPAPEEEPEDLEEPEVREEEPEEAEIPEEEETSENPKEDDAF